MTGPNTSGRAQADHYRELALWTSDERTRHILMEMARELEAEAAGAMPAPDEGVLRAMPRSLS